MQAEASNVTQGVNSLVRRVITMLRQHPVFVVLGMFNRHLCTVSNDRVFVHEAPKYRNSHVLAGAHKGVRYSRPTELEWRQ